MGRAFNKECLGFRKQWKDAYPGERDSYIVKAQQKKKKKTDKSPGPRQFCSSPKSLSDKSDRLLGLEFLNMMMYVGPPITKFI